MKFRNEVPRRSTAPNTARHIALGLMLLITPGKADDFSMAPAWSLAPGDRPYLTGQGNLECGLAYNPLTDHLLLVSRLNDSTLRSIAALAAADGADAGTLSISGISGGTRVLSKIGVADDGTIYAANFGTYSISNPFKVYRWASENAAPTIAFSGDPGKGFTHQWGGAMAVRGAAENTQILLPSDGTVISILSTTNGTNFTATVLNTDAPAGAFTNGVAFGAGDTFWGKTNGGPLRLMQFDLDTALATTAQNLASFPFLSTISPLAVDPVNRLLAGLDLAGPDTLALYDIANAGAPVLLGTIGWPTDNANPLFDGALSIYPGGKLFALNGNNGVSAYNVVPPSRLAILPAAANVAVQWPQRFGGSVLQTRSGLSGQGAWSNLVVTPQTNSGTLQLTLPQTNGGKFYRLQRTVRVMTYNIDHGQGTDGVIDLPRIAGVITNAGADIVGLQEVDQKTQRSGGVDEAAELGRLTGMNHFFRRNINYQGGGYGTAVLSRFPIRQQNHVLLAMLNSADEQRGVDEVVMDLGGAEFVLLNTHLDAGTSDDERLYEIQQIGTIAQGYGGRPILLCGDCNTRPTDPPYVALQADFVDAWLVAGQGAGYTFNSTSPDRRIDYFWYPPGRQTPIWWWIPTSNGSDHLPLEMEWLEPAPGH